MEGKLRPKKPPIILMSIAIIKTAVLFFVSIIADTAGIIRYEKTGITPLILTATIAKPMEI